jgi:uncharacterized NAD-dependent epimerase/dehydratase family protein
MKNQHKTNAVLYCEGLLNSVHKNIISELVVYSTRYNVLALIDSETAGEKSSLMNVKLNHEIKIYSSLDDCIKELKTQGIKPETFVLGIINNYTQIDENIEKCIGASIKNGLNIDSGLFDPLPISSRQKEAMTKSGIALNEVRHSMPLYHDVLAEEKLEKVESVIIGVVGTDKEIAIRDTSFSIRSYFREEGYKCKIIGTTMTSWMLGNENCMFLNSSVKEFIPSIIQNNIVSLWENDKPHFIIIESDGSLLNPFYPGGHELLRCGNLDIIILQHNPNRNFYYGTQESTVHSLQRQMKAVEIISGKSVSAIVINAENIKPVQLENIFQRTKLESDIPVYDMSLSGKRRLVKYLANISGRLNYKKVRFQRRTATV